MLVDLRPTGITGKDAEQRARRRRHHGQQERHPQRPADARSSRAASASARPPSPRAASTRARAHTIGCLIAQTVFNRDDAAKLANIKQEVAELLGKHPLYPEL